MSRFAARLSIILALCATVILPDITEAGLFRRRCRPRRYCVESTPGGRTVEAVTAGCETGSICVQRLAAKYLDASGKCVYAMYDATRCPSMTTTHYDTNCGYSCPKSCTTSPCQCISRTTVTAIGDGKDPRDQSYSATIELLEKGLTAPVESAEYPAAKVVSEYVIQVEKDKRVKIIWLKISPGRYAGTGYVVSDATPRSPQEIDYKAKRIPLPNNKPAKAFQVEVNRINGIQVDQDYVVLVDY